MKYLEKFIQSAIGEAEAEVEGNPKKADKFGKKMREIAISLYKADRIEELEILLTHENPSVRGNAAIKLLPFATEKAEDVLQELAEKSGLSIYFVARNTLEEWRKGNIKFSYYQK